MGTAAGADEPAPEPSSRMQGGADESKLTDIVKYINNTPGSKHKFTQKEASALSTDLALVRPLLPSPYSLSSAP